MFTNFIIIIIAILLFTTPLGESEPRFSPYITLINIFSVYLVYWAIVVYSLRKIDQIKYPFSYSFIRRGKFLIAQRRLVLLGLFSYGCIIFFLDLKSITFLFPFEALKNGIGLSFFFFFLLIVWFYSYSFSERASTLSITRGSYVFTQLRFNGGLVLPWFFANIVIDLSGLLPYNVTELIKTNEWIQILLFPISLLLLAVFSPLFIKVIWGCKPINDSRILELVAQVSRKSGVKIGEVVLWPSVEAMATTAGIMGIISRFRYLLLSPSIMNMLSAEELKAVLFHEVGHVRHKHIVYNLLLFIGFGLFTMLYADFFSWILYVPGIVKLFPDLFFTGDGIFLNLLFTVGMIFLIILYFRYLFGFFSRNFEREADQFSLVAAGSSVSLVTALEKVAAINGIDKNESNWHHFGIMERIETLQNCEKRPDLIEKHSKRVNLYKFIYGFVLTLIILGLGFSVFKQPEEEFRKALLEGRIESLIEKEMNNPGLYLLKAQIKTEENKNKEAVEAYEKVLELDNKNITALNNLAWILVTVKDDEIKNYKKGLEYAKRAAAIVKKPYILDTLAESYFANGYIAEAIKAEEEAIEIERKDKTYFTRQLEKFKREFQSKR